MVYCNYIINDDKCVSYAYGGSIDDITGELKFHFQDDKIEIVRKPKNNNIVFRHINSLYGKHRDEFKKGIFKEKIAWEV